jgi:hypothetical protein
VGGDLVMTVLGVEYKTEIPASICHFAVKLTMRKGETMSPEQRAKISAANKGRNLGNHYAAGARAPETGERIRAARRAGTEARGPVSYGAMHKRLVKDRGAPSLCEHCGTTTAKKFEWAYTGEGHEHGAWSTNPDDYIRLCTSCHVIFDRHPLPPGGRR